MNSISGGFVKEESHSQSPAGAVSRKELRQFGILAGALVAAVLGGLIPRLRSHPYPLWPWVVGTGLVGVGAIYPAALKYPFALWTAAGKLLGWLNTRFILALLFYLLVTPMGWMMRLLGRDPMTRRFEPAAQSYRRPSRPITIKSLERPF